MPHIVRFGSFEADLDSGQLRKRGIRVKLRDQSFLVLASLLEHQGQVVTREELRRRLWRNQVFVDFDNNLNIIVGRLRAALGDSAEHPHFIETLPKRGYRFIGAISESMPGEDSSKPPLAKLVVLPFQNLTGDPGQEYLSDGVTDEIITEIASCAPHRLAVIARTTAMSLKVRPKNLLTIRRTLAVDYVVEGSLRRNGDTISINVQLIRTSEQTHLFARRYDSAACDIFNLRNRIVQDIAAHIPPLANLPAAADATTFRRRPPTSNLAAYNEYIQGRYFLAKGGPEAIAAAKQHLEKALAGDPEFALAHDAFAELYWYMGYTGVIAPRKAFSTGIIHAVRAIEVDNRLAESHALLGEFHKTLGYNWPEVHREMALALQLDPNSPLVRTRYAVSELMPHAQLQEALSELERALELDPLSLLPRLWMGIILLLARRYEEAIQQGKKLLELEPSYYMAYFILGNAYRYLGRLDEALDAQSEAIRLSGEAAWLLGWLGLTLARNGDKLGARSLLDRLRQIGTTGYVPASSFAWIHLGLQEIDIAFRWLDRAVDECDQLMMPIKSYAFLDPIRSDPRFGRLLHKMNLEP
jgi:TolB-like protein